MQLNKAIDSKGLDGKYNIFGEPSDEDYELLKSKFIKGEFPKEKLFIYTSKACDNLVDRSDECFSSKSLKDIAELMVAKPCIEDHYHDMKGQYARVYKAEVIKDSTRKNEFGDDYEYVIAYCYMVNNDKTKFIIDDIVSGIRKEASVGCSVESCICSICGTDMHKSSCNHRLGEVYSGKVCAHILDGVNDFYELSSVPVPCQREAGVIKTFKEEDKNMAMTADMAFVEIGKMPGVNSEAINVIKSEIKKLSNPDIEAKNITIKSLEEQLVKKEAKIKELEEEIDSSKKMKVYKELFDTMKPKSKEAEDIVMGLLDGKVGMDESGEYNIPDDIKEMLKDKYDFLFDVSEEYEDEEEMEEEKEMDSVINMKPSEEEKSIKFTNSTVNKKYSSDQITDRVLKTIKNRNK